MLCLEDLMLLCNQLFCGFSSLPNKKSERKCYSTSFYPYTGITVNGKINSTCMFISLKPRDPSYVPDTEGVNGRVRYGDLVLVLKKKEVRQEYIMSLLEVKDIEVRTQYLENTSI